MRHTEIADAFEASNGEAIPSGMCYGCLFCHTGKENAVARSIQARYPEVRAVAARRVKHKIIDGRKSSTVDILLPGYVFFEAPAGMNVASGLRMENVIRILRVDQGTWQLQDADRDFARWLFDQNGLLDMSHAYKENDKVRIVSGPLKDLEASIQKVDRRGGRGQVRLDFNGQTFMVWLSFEMVAPNESEGKELDQCTGIHAEPS